MIRRFDRDGLRVLLAERHTDPDNQARFSQPLECQESSRERRDSEYHLWV